MSNPIKHWIVRMSPLRTIATVLVFTACLSSPAEQPSPTPEQAATGTADILIRNGTLYDGLSEEGRSADVAISNGKIIAVGSFKGTASEVIDATGLIVAPGFIDCHTHTDYVLYLFKDQIIKDKIYEDFFENRCYLRQGVTTIMTGLCGTGFSDIDEYFNILKENKFGANVGHFMPHGFLRKLLFGDNQPVKLNDEQMTMMKKALDKAMRKGVFGLTTGLEYMPGKLADGKELLELCKVLKKRKGVYVSHVRDESGLNPLGSIGVLNGYAEAIMLGISSGVSVQISHAKVAEPFNGVTVAQLLTMVEKAQEMGLDLTLDQYPYDYAGGTLNSLFPAKYLKDDDNIKDEYRSGDGKNELLDEANKIFPGFDPKGLGKSIITVIFDPAKDKFNGKTIDTIATELSMTQIGAIVEVITTLKEPTGGMFYFLREDDVREIMKKDYVFTCSDGQNFPEKMADEFPTHPRSYGAFPRKLGTYVRDLKDLNIISMGKAIRSMTSLPARKFRLERRGEIAVGNYADVTVFNPATIADLAVPGQLKPRNPVGIEYVIVNGVVALRHDEPTGLRAGSILRPGRK